MDSGSCSPESASLIYQQVFPLASVRIRLQEKSYSLQGSVLTLFQYVRLSTAHCNVFTAFLRKSTNVKYQLIALKG